MKGNACCPGGVYLVVSHNGKRIKVYDSAYKGQLHAGSNLTEKITSAKMEMC